MDIDDDAISRLLRSTRERVRVSRELEAGILESILTSTDLIRRSRALLLEGDRSPLLKFHLGSASSSNK